MCEHYFLTSGKRPGLVRHFLPQPAADADWSDIRRQPGEVVDIDYHGAQCCLPRRRLHARRRHLAHEAFNRDFFTDTDYRIIITAHSEIGLVAGTAR